MQNRPQEVNYAELRAFAKEMLADNKAQYGDGAFTSLIEVLKQYSQQEFLQNNYELAKKILNLIIELCVENHADKNKKTITDALHNLFLVFEKQGEKSYQEADRLFQHYHQLLKKTYQEEVNLPLIYTTYILGQIALKAKRLDEAQFYYEKILKENDSHPNVLSIKDLANVYANLGSILINQDQLKQGQLYLEKALLIYQKFYPEDDEKVLQAKKRIKDASNCNLAKQTKKIFKEEFHLVGGDSPLDPNAYLAISSCKLRMSIQNNQIVFSINGIAESINALRGILTGSNGLLHIMNQASQSGSWSVSDHLPCEENTPNQNQLTLIYTDKLVNEIFQHNLDEELYIRSDKIRNYFLKHRFEIWYQSLVELSCYFHLPLLSRPENQIHGSIRKLDTPKDDGIWMDVGSLEYVTIPSPQQIFTLEARLHDLLASVQDPKADALRIDAIRHLASFPVGLVNELEKQTEFQIEDTIALVNQHMDTLKNILFQAYSGQEIAPTLKLDEWLNIVSCLQLLSIFKVGFVRRLALLHKPREDALLERARLQREEDYKNLQTSKRDLLDGKQGPYIVADDNYPERQNKGWPFTRTLPKIERLHGLWNTRSTLNDETMLSKEQNRLDFGKVLQKNDVVVDFGAGNGNFLRDIQKEFAHLNLYLVAMGIDPLDDTNLSAIDEIWYMPLPLAKNMQAFVDRFKGKVGLVTCTFGATTYAITPHKVVILAAYLLRRGGRFSAIISSQPGHYDGTPLGYTDDRKELADFVKKYLGVDMTSHWTSIQSEVVQGAKPIDFKLDIVRSLEAPEITHSLQELFSLADIEIGIPNKLQADPNHPYKFKSQSIDMREYLRLGKTPQNNIQEFGHINKALLDILPVKDFGVVFQISLAMDTVDVLEKIYQKVNERIVKSSIDQIISSWTVEKNVSEKSLTISYIEPTSYRLALTGQYSQYLAYLASDAGKETVKDIWINLLEKLLFKGIVIPGITEKIDSFQYPTLPEGIPLPPLHEGGQLSIPVSFDPALHVTMFADAPVPHAETGEPVFTFRVVGQYEGSPRQDMGSISLYGRPSLCRSVNGDRSNVIYADGVFANAKITIAEIPDICDSLPPTLAEKHFQAATGGAIHGIIRGSANVFGNMLGTRSITNTMKTLITESVYYVSYFAYRCLDRGYLNSATDEVTTYDVGYKALADTVGLFAANMVVSGAQKLVGHASQQANTHQWKRTSKTLDLAKKGIGLTLFGYLGYDKNTGLAPFFTAVASGALTQTAVELGGNKIMKRT